MVLEVLRYIEEHYREGQLQNLAHALHCDPDWLSREFKRQTGKTFTELMQTRRLNQRRPQLLAGR